MATIGSTRNEVCSQDGTHQVPVRGNSLRGLGEPRANIPALCSRTSSTGRTSTREADSQSVVPSNPTVLAGAQEGDGGIGSRHTAAVSWKGEHRSGQ
jgi:hypothetical protein